MAFITDRQTLDDLNLLGKYKSNSAFGIFNRCSTRKGELLMENWFQNPLQDPQLIARRSSIIHYFHDRNVRFPVDPELFEDADFYFNISAAKSGFGSLVTLVRYRVRDNFSREKLFEKIRGGIGDAMNILSQIKHFVHRLDEVDSSYRDELDHMSSFFTSAEYIRCEKIWKKRSRSFIDIIRLDGILRWSLKQRIDLLLDYIYEIDVYISAAQTARERGYAYAQALPAEEHSTKITGLFHPALKGAVTNDVEITRGNNMFFLTGANMAGKSTFMKSYGTAIYLAHVGFPVPAATMRFSVLDGMFTSINVADNIAMGYSHFYAEVLRVKSAAENVGSGLNLLIIFDELFKGTNVKDAYDATAAIAEAFAWHSNCQYIISTHILEVADYLKSRCVNVQFNYLPTIMDGQIPRYTYKLAGGISADRHGMMIIGNERIVEMINDIADKN